MSSQKHIAVLISGSGSNLQSFIDAGINVGVVISNRPDSYGLVRARNANIPVHVVDHTEYNDRESFEKELIKTIDMFDVSAVVLAGFMRILTPLFVEAYKGKLFNIHPSLLPKYPGLHTHKRAIAAQDDYAGATVHFVTEELDGGPAIIQARVKIKQHDTEQTLANRVLKEEHQMYPAVINWFLCNELELANDEIYFKGRKLLDVIVQDSSPSPN
jgi:phosphoribosylglycinamide formyltransferase 1